MEALVLVLLADLCAGDRGLLLPVVRALRRLDGDWVLFLKLEYRFEEDLR